MSEPNHLVVLRRSLTLLEEAVPLISDEHDRQIIEEHAKLMRLNIRRLEEWAKEQEAIRTQGDQAFESELKCGEA